MLPAFLSYLLSTKNSWISTKFEGKPLNPGKKNAADLLPHLNLLCKFRKRGLWRENIMLGIVVNTRRHTR